MTDGNGNGNLIWKITATSLLTFLLGILGAGAFGHFQNATLESRIEALELTVSVNSHRITELENTQIQQNRHMEETDKQVQELFQEIREETATSRRNEQRR